MLDNSLSQGLCMSYYRNPRKPDTQKGLQAPDSRSKSLVKHNENPAIYNLSKFGELFETGAIGEKWNAWESGLQHIQEGGHM